MDTVKKIVRNVKEVAMDYDDVQLRVRDATSNDPVGADDRLLARIAHDTRERSAYNSMFSILWKRITDLHQPSHILKSLILTEYLLIHGDDRFVRDMRTKKNVVKRLTGYKFYRNHEDVGGEVRNQARTVLELLINENALEKMRKDRDAGILNLAKTDRYERNYGNEIKSTDDFGDSVPLDSPHQKPVRIKESSLSFNNSSPDSPSNQEAASRSKSVKKYSSEAITNQASKKKKKKDKKKAEVKEVPDSFASSLSDDNDVEQITKGMANFNTASTEVNVVTNQGAAPIDWLTGMNFSTNDSMQAFPALSFESSEQVFHGTPIDPSTPKGSPHQDGFAFDDALEIGSDDDNDKGFWNVDKKLVDLSDLNAHGPHKKPQVVTGAAPGKTLAEIAAANGNPAVPSNFAIHPIQSIPQQFAHQPPYGYTQQQPGPFGFSQPRQQMTFNQVMGMGFGQPANTFVQSGSQYMQQQQQQQQQQQYMQLKMASAGHQAPAPNPFQNPAQPAQNPFQMPVQTAQNQNQSQSKSMDPFAGLWQP